MEKLSEYCYQYSIKKFSNTYKDNNCVGFKYGNSCGYSWWYVLTNDYKLYEVTTEIKNNDSKEETYYALKIKENCGY